MQQMEGKITSLYLLRDDCLLQAVKKVPLHLNSTWTLQQFWAYFAYVTHYHIRLWSIRLTKSTLKLPKQLTIRS